MPLAVLAAAAGFGSGVLAGPALRRAAPGPTRWPPGRAAREVARVQAPGGCAVGFEVRDSVFRRMRVFNAEARGREGAAVARGYAYAPHGWRVGETAYVVLPGADCAAFVVGGFGGLGASWTAPARPGGPGRR